MLGPFLFIQIDQRIYGWIAWMNIAWIITQSHIILPFRDWRKINHREHEIDFISWGNPQTNEPRSWYKYVCHNLISNSKWQAQCKGLTMIDYSKYAMLPLYNGLLNSNWMWGHQYLCLVRQGTLRFRYMNSRLKSVGPAMQVCEGGGQLPLCRGKAVRVGFLAVLW